MGTEGAGPSHAALEGSFADVLICADDMGRFIHVGPSHLTQGADGVGAAGPLSQE